MTEETIVAVYDTAADAEAAVQDLQAANVPPRAISREPSTTGTSATATSTSATAPRPVREQGFWSGLFGGEPDHDTAVYDRSIERGSHVVTVKVPEAHVADVTSILERHNPVDLDDQPLGYGGSGAGPTAAGTRGTAAAGQDPAMMNPGAGGSRGTSTPGQGVPKMGSDVDKLRDTRGVQDTARREGEEVIALAEEQINVGKRLVNRGTTRVRRFVVATPVEENVTLHSERVSIERRPVSGEVPVANADFTDKTIEVTDSDEEAVVNKTTRVKEEVVVRKDSSDRVETVRDNVRREDVEISKAGSEDFGAGGVAHTAPPVNR